MANFSLEGYKRETNPRMAQLETLSFDSVYSCGTATAVSLPCMFSRMDRGNYDESAAKNSDNLLDVLEQAGVRVLWRENNSGCKGICARVDTQTAAELRTPQFCDGDGCFDEILLHQLDQWLESSKGDAFIVLHQQGNHGPEYYKRYPPAFRRFTPECRSNRPQNCTRQALVNAYDNAILYTDFVLSKVVEFLKARKAHYRSAMLYMSDHGESLGEGGIYLHGLPYIIAPEEQKKVPFMLWLSPDYANTERIDRACLSKATQGQYSQDNFFDSVLGLFDIRSDIYRPGRDIFAPCRAPLAALDTAG